MQPGHPIFTEQFDDLRSKQRMSLREVPDWIIAKDRNALSGLKSKYPYEGGRILAEHRLRQRAEEILSRSSDLQEFLRANQEAAGRADVLNVLNALDNIPKQADGLVDYCHEVPTPREIPIACSREFWEYLSCLILADSCDLIGYTDPRLTKY